MKKKEKTKNPIQPVSGTKVPRFAGPSTFARLPEMRDVKYLLMQELVTDQEQDLVHKV